MPQLLTLFLLIFTVCGCGKEERNFDTNPALQDLDGDGFGYYEDCDDTNASIGQPEAGCAPGGICSDDSKCASQVCDLSNSEVRGTQRFGRCQAPSCDDDTKNGSETDLDCGGECGPCMLRQLCERNTDCVSRCALVVDEEVRCGDGVVSDGETCDDGNTVDGDECTNACTRPACDDGIKNGPETDVDCGGSCATRCAVGAICVTRSDCQTDICDNGRCTQPRCGDGLVSDGEQCDDGNQIPTDACTNECTIARCGDGITRLDIADGQLGFEGCDDGNQVNDDACRNDCVLPSCGDGVTQPGEACDDGNQVNDDACSNICQLARCGDGIVHVGEECDDGNAADDDACTNLCRNAACGDGIVRTGLPSSDAAYEACDDGNLDNTDQCLNSCIVASCGDGFAGPTEQCDDGNEINDDSCSNICETARCGDGILHADEDCDDRNSNNADTCLNSCINARCGDGIVGPNEQCDDGNTVTESCAYGESNCQVCAEDCSLQYGVSRVCGDNVHDPEEECDDGDLQNGDGCDNNCTVTGCGNGILTDGEVCDDGGAGRCLNNCSQCEAHLTGPACDQCVVGIGFEAPICDECARGFTGDGCDRCGGMIFSGTGGIVVPDHPDLKFAMVFLLQHGLSQRLTRRRHPQCSRSQDSKAGRDLCCELVATLSSLSGLKLIMVQRPSAP